MSQNLSPPRFHPLVLALIRATMDTSLPHVETGPPGLCSFTCSSRSKHPCSRPSLFIWRGCRMPGLGGHQPQMRCPDLQCIAADTSTELREETHCCHHSPRPKPVLNTSAMVCISSSPLQSDASLRTCSKRMEGSCFSRKVSDFERGSGAFIYFISFFILFKKFLLEYS